VESRTDNTNIGKLIVFKLFNFWFIIIRSLGKNKNTN